MNSCRSPRPWELCLSSAPLHPPHLLLTNAGNVKTLPWGKGWLTSEFSALTCASCSHSQSPRRMRIWHQVCQWRGWADLEDSGCWDLCRAGWCPGRAGDCICCHDKGNPEPGVGQTAPKTEWMERWGNTFRILDQDGPGATSPGRFSMGSNKSIFFSLGSRIPLLGKEVSLTDPTEPREGKLFQGDSVARDMAGFPSSPCRPQEQIRTPWCDIQGLTYPGLFLPFWLRILLVALP